MREPEWLDTDWWLAQALELYEARLCPDCKQPRDVAWHPDQEGFYDVSEQSCHGCGALVEWAAQERTPPIDRRYKLTLVDTRPPDRPLFLPTSE